MIIVGAISIWIGIIGFTTHESTGEATIITRGWFRAAVENKPELEVKHHYKEVPADGSDRFSQAFFGVCLLGGGLFIIRMMKKQIQ